MTEPIEFHHDTTAHAFAEGFGVTAPGCAFCALLALPQVTVMYAVAYDDPTPYMDGPRTIRLREVDDYETAKAMLDLVAARSERAPKANLHIETRNVSAWRTV